MCIGEGFDARLETKHIQRTLENQLDWCLWEGGLLDDMSLFSVGVLEFVEGKVEIIANRC
jgi:hypothetical protein